MSIADQITRLSNAKAAIKTSIENKGITVGDDVKLDGYPALIDSIEAGGGSGEIHVNPDFYELRTQNGTNYNHLFYDYSGPYIDISQWDTSKVTTMSYTFYSSYIKTLNLSNWDTSNVTDITFMFCNSSVGTYLDLSNFKTSKINSLSRTFSGFSAETLDISNWDTSNVYTVNYTFTNSRNLKTVIGCLDLSNLSNGFYPGSYNNPVNNCPNLETLYLKNIYKNCTMTNASKWSINLSPTKIKDSCLLYIIDQLPNLYEKGITNNTNIVLTLPPTNTLTQEQVQVAIDKGWSVANTTY